MSYRVFLRFLVGLRLVGLFLGVWMGIFLGEFFSSLECFWIMVRRGWSWVIGLFKIYSVVEVCRFVFRGINRYIF